MDCLSSRGPNSEKLLRYASRLAGKLNRNWYAVYVQTQSIGRKAHESNGIWLFEPSEIEAQVSTDVVLTRTILRRLIPQRDAAFYE